MQASHFGSEMSNSTANRLQQAPSQASYRDSARKALAATKYVDGSLSLSTSQLQQQMQHTNRQMACLKERMNQLNQASHNYSVRCQSKLNDSSTASVTAATSYAPHGGHGHGLDSSQRFAKGAAFTGSNAHLRPNSNISNVHGAGNGKTFMTDLTRFSQNSVSKDLSPLRASQLLCQSNPSASRQVLTKSQKKIVGAFSGAQNSRQIQQHKAGRTKANVKTNHGGYSPLYSKNILYRGIGATSSGLVDKNRISSKTRKNSKGRACSGSIARSASYRPRSTQSLHSMRTNNSSPERLVNIVCPPSQSAKRTAQGQRVSSRLSGLRPGSDLRQRMYNSFAMTDAQNARNTQVVPHAQRIARKMKSFSNSQAYLMSSFTSNNRSNKRLCCQTNNPSGTYQNNNNGGSRRLVTPIKSSNHRSTHSYSRSKSQSKSLTKLAKTSIRSSSTPGLSQKKSKRKGSGKRGLLQNQLSKWVKKRVTDSQKRRRSSSRMSSMDHSRNSSLQHSRSKSANQITMSANSNNGMGRSSEALVTRDQRRASKYLKNQKESSRTSIKKSFNFASIEANQRPPQLEPPTLTSQENSNMKPTAPSGQVTGKFRSLNETAFHQLATPLERREGAAAGAQSGFNSSMNRNNVAFHQSTRLQTEDDFAETLTASSDDSPLRPSQRVQRAAKMATKAYLEDIDYRLAAAQTHGQNSVRQFGPRKMKAAYQGINERQGARLVNLKQQMQDSLIETHQLQAKLQSSGNLGHHHSHSNTGGISQFNSLVLGFSNNLENMATEMIEATESKAKNRRMKSMISELQMTRKMRSESKSAPASARRSTADFSNSKRQRSSAKKKGLRSHSKSSLKKGSSLTSRSRSSRKSSVGKSSRNGSRRTSAKKSIKGKKLARKLTKSLKKLSKKVTTQKKSKSRGRSTDKKSVRSASKSKSQRHLSGRSGVSRGRSRSRKKIKSVKQNIYELTNGFRDISGLKTSQASASKRGQKRSVSRKSQRSRSKSAPRSKSPFMTRAIELTNKCAKLITSTYKVADRRLKAKKRSLSRQPAQRSVSKKRKSIGGKKAVSKSRSKSKKAKVTSKRRKTKSRSKSARKGSKSPLIKRRKSTATTNALSGYKCLATEVQVTPEVTPYVTPCMTPLQKILRNSMGDAGDMTDPWKKQARFGSAAVNNKKVKIFSRRLQDISQLTSSDSSSADSDDSLDNELYLKRQQAHLPHWQRECIRKQLPKKFR